VDIAVRPDPERSFCGQSLAAPAGLLGRSGPRRPFVCSRSGDGRPGEAAFATTLGKFETNGKTVRLATTPLSVPSFLAALISGVVGVNQQLASPEILIEPSPPAAFVNPRLCSNFWGTKTDTTDNPLLYSPYTHKLPYDICGYTPAQLGGAYSIPPKIKSAFPGTGVSVAIVDACDSPTILTDARKYFSINDPAHPLPGAQFHDNRPATTANIGSSDGSLWADEQALDVEAVHTMAPGATINYFGAVDCSNSSLLDALNSAIHSGAKVVSNSWGNTFGDLFTDPNTQSAFDTLFQTAGSLGVSVLFSSGDAGDNSLALACRCRIIRPAARSSPSWAAPLWKCRA
jgi:subtilase family serine protease